MKKILIGLTFLVSMSTFANVSTKLNVCVINKITCIGCGSDALERAKDALIKRNYIFDESDNTGQEVRIEFNQSREKAKMRIQSICQYQWDGEAGIVKALLGLDWKRYCEYSEKEEEERLTYLAGDANFHSLSVQTSAHSRGFFTARKVKNNKSISRKFETMLSTMDLEDCI